MKRNDARLRLRFHRRLLFLGCALCILLSLDPMSARQDGPAGGQQPQPLPVRAGAALQPSTQPNVAVESGPEAVVDPSSAPTDALANNNAGSTGTANFTQSETTVLAFGNTVVTAFNDSGSFVGGAGSW